MPVRSARRRMARSPSPRDAPALTVTDIAGMFFQPRASQTSARDAPVAVAPCDGPPIRRSRHSSRHPAPQPQQQLAFLLAADGPTAGQRQARRRLGRIHESGCLEKYMREQRCVVTDQNTTTAVRPLVLPSGQRVAIKGRVDGMADDATTVVEVKYRTRGLLRYVPMHELVQCHLYMYLTGTTRAHLVESHASDIWVHRLQFDAVIWDCVLRRIDRPRGGGSAESGGAESGGAESGAHRDSSSSCGWG